MARIHKVDHPALYQELCKSTGEENEKNDCSIKAVAAACGVKYSVAKKALEEAGRKARKGAYTSVVLKAVETLGHKTTRVNPEQIINKYPGVHATLKGITTHHPRRFSKVWPEGTFVLFMKGHVATVIDGEVQDWTINRAKRVTSLYRVK